MEDEMIRGIKTYSYAKDGNGIGKYMDSRRIGITSPSKKPPTKTRRIDLEMSPPLTTKTIRQLIIKLMDQDSRATIFSPVYQ